jgi:hypothetical protein
MIVGFLSCNSIYLILNNAELLPSDESYSM